MDAWSRVLGVGVALGLAADSLGRLDPLGLRVDERLAGAATAQRLGSAWELRRQAVERIAERMTARVDEAPPPHLPDDRGDVLASLRQDLADGRATPADSASVVGLAITAEWLAVVDHLLEVVEPSVAAVEAHTGTPWWR